MSVVNVNAATNEEPSKERSSSPLIYQKMILIMKDIGAVSKDQRNTDQKFMFRGIDQFVNALYPVLCRHGVFMVPKCVSEHHELKDVVRNSGKKGIDKHVHIKMEYSFFAEDGSSIVVGPIASEGLDSGDKATSKALSAALKYTLIQTFCTPTEDMSEGDSESPEIGSEVRSDFQRRSPDPSSPLHSPIVPKQQQPIPEASAAPRFITDRQRAMLFSLLPDCRTTEEQLRAYCKLRLKIDSLKNIPIKHFDNLVRAIKGGFVSQTQPVSEAPIEFATEKYIPEVPHY